MGSKELQLVRSRYHSADATPSPAMDDKLVPYLDVRHSSEGYPRTAYFPLAGEMDEAAANGHPAEALPQYSQPDYASLERLHSEMQAITPVLTQYNTIMPDTNGAVLYEHAAAPRYYAAPRPFAYARADHPTLDLDNDVSALAALSLPTIPQAISMSPPTTVPLATSDHVKYSEFLGGGPFNDVPHSTDRAAASNGVLMDPEALELDELGDPAGASLDSNRAILTPIMNMQPRGYRRLGTSPDEPASHWRNRYTAEENLFIVRAREKPDNIPWWIIPEAAKLSYTVGGGCRNGRNMQVHYSQTLRRCCSKLSQLTESMRRRLDSIVKEKLEILFAGVSDEFQRVEKHDFDADNMARSYMRTRMEISKHTLEVSLAAAKQLKMQNAGLRAKQKGKSKPKSMRLKSSRSETS